MRAEVKAPPKPERRVSFGRWTQIVLFASVLMAALSGATFAFAQAADPTLSINLGTGDGLTARVLQLAALITVLSLAPSIIIMTTSFVRIVVVLSLLRTAIGLQQAPERGDRVAVAVLDGVCNAAGLERGVSSRHRAGDERGNAAG